MKTGDLVAERYALEEVAGTGGMSSVYRAWDRLLERRVALKILADRYSSDPEYVERFKREARAIAGLSHPNIVTVIDRGEWEGHQFIVFEYVGGETLKDLVHRVGPLPVRDALALVREVARGLAFAHDHGVVHRDVKPQNVIIDPEGTPKVTDFGIARSLDRDDGLTTTGALLGTSDYLAPEQAAGQPVSPQSDQYSLGVLLYELLTGDVPYPAESLVATAMRHRNDPVPSVAAARPDVPAAVDELVRRAMQKRPEERFRSTEAFVAALESCLGPAAREEDTLSDVRAEEPDGAATRVIPSPAPTPPRERARERRSRRAPLLAVLAFLLVSGGVAAAVFFALAGGGSSPSGGSAQGEDGGSDGGAAAVRLRAVSDYDPDGDQSEHPEDVPKATDGNEATYWTTETYQSFTKPGVGIVVKASEPVDGGTLVVRSDSGDFTAVVRGSGRPGGGFRTISGSQTVGTSTSFALDTKGESYPYLLVWITDPGPDGRAHVNEVTYRS